MACRASDHGSFSLLAKLGDTQELEEFIADLDKVLEGMYGALISAMFW